MSSAGGRVLVTGAAGLVGTQLREALADRPVRLHDRDLSGVTPKPNEELVEADLGDYDGMRRAVEGCDSVVHLAADPSTRATWEDLRVPNVDGTYHVFEAAREAGCRRVVFASSNHATGILDEQRRWPIDPYGEVAPDSLYGVTKAFGEALGRYYAEKTDLTVVCLRIGWANHRQHPDNADWRRMWISFEDLGQLIRRSLDTSDINFAIYYGVSDNTPMRYDLTNAREELGFCPDDDSADVVRNQEG